MSGVVQLPECRIRDYGNECKRPRTLKRRDWWLHQVSGLQRYGTSSRWNSSVGPLSGPGTVGVRYSEGSTVALVKRVRDVHRSGQDQWNNNNLVQLPLLLDFKRQT